MKPFLKPFLLPQNATRLGSWALGPAAGLAILLLALGASASLLAAAEEQELDITKFADSANLVPISLAGYSGDVQSVLKFDLEVAGFKIVTPETAPFNVIGSNNGAVEGRVTAHISKAALLENRRYSGGTLRSQAHAFADDIVLKLTGRRGIAQTKIAFRVQTGAQMEIYLADYDGANAVALTQDRVKVDAPCWVPGKRMLYYSSFRSGFPDIYSQDVASGDRKIVARYSGLNTSPAVSPDGRRLAMILSKDGSPNLYVANADGTNPKPLTQGKETASSPCWSPDGRTICFASRAEGTPALYLVSADGGSKRRLRTAGAASPTEPDWSPDGKWIVFTSMRSDFSICVVPAEGGEAVTLTSGEDPSWAPNSRTVIFTRVAKGRRSLSLLDVKTKQVKDVAQNLGSCSQPSWAR